MNQRMHSAWMTMQGGGMHHPSSLSFLSGRDRAHCADNRSPFTIHREPSMLCPMTIVTPHFG